MQKQKLLEALQAIIDGKEAKEIFHEVIAEKTQAIITDKPADTKNKAE